MTMPERLYTDYPELYDLIQSDWDYGRDITFISQILAQHDVDGNRLLDVGCGTGEHTRRFVEQGFEVTAIDKYEGMLSVAREKCDANFQQMALPELTIDERYDVIVAIRGVINHLSHDDLMPALRALESRLADDGVLVFDNSPLPPEGNHPAIDIGTTEHGDYARIAQHVLRDDGRLNWNSITFGPDGEMVVNSRTMTPFEDETIVTALNQLGVTIDIHDGFGPDDDRTVFVAHG